MKNLLCLNIFFVFFTFQTFKLFAQERDSNAKIASIVCEIVKIDSVGDYYVIYAKDTLDKYKIVSQKDSTVFQNIVVGEHYKLTLFSHTGEHKTFPTNVLQVFPGGVAIIPYGWGDGLYIALEIKGLCYKAEFAIDILKKRKELEEQDPLKFKNKSAKKRYFKKRIKEEKKKIGNIIYYEKDPLFSDD